MKKILLCICIFSFCYSSYSDRLKNNGYNNSEYSIGLNDKTSFYGLISKSWIKDKDYGESYVTLGGVGLVGSLGYGRKYYLRRGRFFSPYVSAKPISYPTPRDGIVTSATITSDDFNQSISLLKI